MMYDDFEIKVSRVGSRRHMILLPAIGNDYHGRYAYMTIHKDHYYY